ncbi:MAG: hypothetical protein JW785_10540 [Acidimicrobiia bacterium]|nr:hypothetical protein [Acidimicrobiia bacterium]
MPEAARAEAAVPEAFPRAVAGAEPGRVLGLVGPPGSGLTRLGLSLLADPARRGPVAVVDVRGWLCPPAAWEAGVPPERLVVVRCAERDLWARVTAALLEGLPAVYAEVPAGVNEAVLRRLGALARSRRAALILRPLRGDLPSGLAHLNLVGEVVRWEGAGPGHGRLTRRWLTLRAAGRGVGGIDRVLEVVDDGTDALRVVPRLAAAPAGRAAG